MGTDDPIGDLAKLLAASGARMVIAPERLAPSAIYDVDYRAAVVACAFQLHAMPYGQDRARISVPRLKLLQFMAIRPWLLPVLRLWAASRAQPQLNSLAEKRMRRGFMSDHLHDDVVDFFNAANIFLREGDHIVSGPEIGRARQLYDDACEQELFIGERKALEVLKGIRVTHAMLEGW